VTDLSGKTALVTGSSRGIGAGIAEALAAHGAAVGVNYASGQKEADAVVRRIIDAGGRAIPVQADVSSAADVERMVAQVSEALGPVTILVNNAGLTDTHRPWQTISEADWDRVLDVNLKSCYLTLRAVYPGMKEAEWGRIINISSVTFHLGMKNLLHYVSSGRDDRFHPDAGAGCGRRRHHGHAITRARSRSRANCMCTGSGIAVNKRLFEDQSIKAARGCPPTSRGGGVLRLGGSVVHYRADVECRWRAGRCTRRVSRLESLWLETNGFARLFFTRKTQATSLKALTNTPVGYNGF